jgi:glycosyltransferase involved in cell wall biosynthesis
MNICLNAQLISDQSGYRGAGVNNYSRQLLAALGQAALDGRTEHRFTAFVHTPDLTVPGVDLLMGSPLLERPAARIVWEQTVLPAALARRKADVVHGLVNVLPLASRAPGVVTVHDLSFVRTPQLLPPLKRVYLTRLCAASVARARAVIAVSRQTAADVMRCFGAPAAKVHVVYNGVGAAFTPGAAPGDAEAGARFRQAKGLPERYFLYLGTLEPRKNLELLVRAFGAWRAEAGPADAGVKLVLAGGKGWYYDAIFAQAAALGLADAVLFPGFIPPAELPDWYRAAELFVYPSVLEGFGLPVLEAMACGVPVVCSQAESLLEVAGEAAVTFPAGDEAALTAALRSLCENPAQRERMRTRGLAQAARFSWTQSAAQTIALYDTVV